MRERWGRRPKSPTRRSRSTRYKGCFLWGNALQKLKGGPGKAPDAKGERKALVRPGTEIPMPRSSLADRTSLYQEVTNRIIAELEQGHVPWVQPWASTPASLGLPKNAATKRNYTGINILILWARSAIAASLARTG